MQISPNAIYAQCTESRVIFLRTFSLIHACSDEVSVKQPIFILIPYFFTPNWKKRSATKTQRLTAKFWVS